MQVAIAAMLGVDGLTRVVTLKTPNATVTKPITKLTSLTTLTRPIAKLVPLPIAHQDQA